MPADTIFFSFDSSKTYNYEILPGYLKTCESFFQRIGQNKDAKDFSTTRIALHMNDQRGIWAGTPIDELDTTNLEP
jgi:hypothetical protein